MCGNIMLFTFGWGPNIKQTTEKCIHSGDKCCHLFICGVLSFVTVSGVDRFVHLGGDDSGADLAFC